MAANVNVTNAKEAVGSSSGRRNQDLAEAENGWAERKDNRGGGASVACGCTSNDLNAVTQ